MPIRKLLVPALVLLILLETGFNLFFCTKLTQAQNAAGLFASSLLFGVLVLLAHYNRSCAWIDYRKSGPLQRWGYGLLWAGLGLVFCYRLAPAFTAVPVDPNFSDIIPLMEVAVRRLLAGRYVYSQVTEFGYSLPLTYLPLQWLPCIPAEVLHFDYRWIAVGINILAVLWLLLRSGAQSPGRTWTLLGLAVYTYAMIRSYNSSILTHTVELMIAGYYLLFVMSLGSRNAVLKGLAIAACLLSRYSLVLWLPLWFFVELISGNRKKLALSAGVVLALVLLLYVIPFLSHDPGIFLRGYKYYSFAALGEWQHLNDRQQPYQLYNGQGFAWLFYSKLSHYTVADRIRSLQKVHLVLSLGSVVIMGTIYWLIRQKIDYRIYLMGSFKIYLSIFLAFIQVPYAYLMITGSFVSIAILAGILRVRTAPAGPAFISS